MTLAVDVITDVDLRVRWPQLPEPRTFIWSEQPVAVLDRGVPWLYGPVERDPLRTARGHIVLPRREIKRLRALAALGVPFQRLAIAHELDPDGAVADILPELREGPRTCTDGVARALVGPQPVHPLVRGATRVFDAVARRTAESVLDPILFGVVGVPEPAHGRPATFYPLVAWRW
jgi:hypothetical protein